MFNWTSELMIGVEEIDAQQREIFRRAAEADEALTVGSSSAQSKELVEYLVGYCETHSSLEQRLMNRLAYPAVGEHLPQHAWFLKEVRAVQRSLAAGVPGEEVAMRLNELLLSWLVNHIGTFDKALAVWLRARPLGVGQTGQA